MRLDEDRKKIDEMESRISSLVAEKSSMETCLESLQSRPEPELVS